MAEHLSIRVHGLLAKQHYADMIIGTNRISMLCAQVNGVPQISGDVALIPTMLNPKEIMEDV
jgi:hypothetical protein